MKSIKQDRRDFIRLGMLGAAGSLLTPLISRAEKFTGSGCAPTTPDILGPFYLANAPSAAQLSSSSEPGTPIRITGTVRSEFCPTPIPNAQVEVWHATDSGAYYNHVNAFSLRGTIFTSASGEYSYDSILPGWYLNGAQYRPRHIHYRVSAPGYATLVTQLYFDGDQYIPADPWASQPSAALRIIPLVNNGGVMEGNFDIYLDDTTTGIKTPYSEKGVLMQNAPNPFNEKTSVYFNVFGYSHVVLSISDMNGREVKRLVDQKFIPGRYQAFWDGTCEGGSSSGNIFIATLKIDDEVLPGIRMIRQR